MPKLSRWIVATRMVEILDPNTVKKILELGGNIGGGWNQIHIHVNVNSHNKETIEKLLVDQGFQVEDVDEMSHPELKHSH